VQQMELDRQRVVLRVVMGREEGVDAARIGL
jgi:hypothetical protein